MDKIFTAKIKAPFYRGFSIAVGLGKLLFDESRGDRLVLVSEAYEINFLVKRLDVYCGRGG